jgi:hypothetical protein
LSAALQVLPSAPPQWIWAIGTVAVLGLAIGLVVALVRVQRRALFASSREIVRAAEEIAEGRFDRMPALERTYLAALFNAIDQAIVAKVSSRRGSTVADAYAPVWRAWEELKPPSALNAMQDQVKAAIVEQQAFLLEIERKQTGWNMNHPKVRSSSGRLHAAYGDLMRMYPNENATNKQAFFDYLCALDFI